MKFKVEFLFNTLKYTYEQCTFESIFNKLTYLYEIYEKKDMPSEDAESQLKGSSTPWIAQRRCAPLLTQSRYDPDYGVFDKNNSKDSNLTICQNGYNTIGRTKPPSVFSKGYFFKDVLACLKQSSAGEEISEKRLSFLK